MYDLRHTISTFSTVYNMYHLSQPDNSTLKNIGYIAITIYICLRMRQKKTTITTNRIILLSRKMNAHKTPLIVPHNKTCAAS